MKLTCITTTGKTANNGINLPLILGASQWAIAIAQLPGCPWCLGLPSSRFPVPSSQFPAHVCPTLTNWLPDWVGPHRIASKVGERQRETGMRPGTEPGCHQWNSLSWCCMLRGLTVPSQPDPSRELALSPVLALSSSSPSSSSSFSSSAYWLFLMANGEWRMGNGDHASHLPAQWPADRPFSMDLRCGRLGAMAYAFFM